MILKELDMVDLPIYIFGYGNLGRNAYRKIKKCYPDRAKGIVITKHYRKTKTLDFVFEMDELEKEKEAIVIVATNSLFHDEITEAISKIPRGSYTVYIYDEELDSDINDRLTELPLIETRFLIICVGQACNFKCRDCVNFAPYAHKENMRYCIEDIKNDLDALLRHFSRIDKLHIQGGEPFLYTDLKELLMYIDAKYRDIIDTVQIATNGGILPSEDVIQVLKKGNYDVRISNYRNVKNAGKLKQILMENNITHHIYEFASANSEWSYSGGLDYTAPEDEDTTSKVLNCLWCTCYTLENGLVGRCARSIPALSLQKIEQKEEDYLVVSNHMSHAMVSRYFMFIKPMECCSHCMGSNGRAIEAAIQL